MKQARGFVSGRVVDVTGKALAGLEVRIERDVGRFGERHWAIAETDHGGRFRVGPLDRAEKPACS